MSEQIFKVTEKDVVGADLDHSVGLVKYAMGKINTPPRCLNELSDLYLETVIEELVKYVLKEVLSYALLKNGLGGALGVLCQALTRKVTHFELTPEAQELILKLVSDYLDHFVEPSRYKPMLDKTLASGTIW